MKQNLISAIGRGEESGVECRSMDFASQVDKIGFGDTMSSCLGT